MTRLLSWLLLLTLFGTFTVVVYTALRKRSEAGRGMPEYSVYSEGSEGLAEAAALLSRLGWESVALTRPIHLTEHRLQTDTLLILADPELSALMPFDSPDLSKADVEGLLHWVEHGNTLLFCGRQMTGIHRALSVTVVHDERVSPDQQPAVAVGEAGGYTEGIDRLVVEGRDVLQSEAGLPLWWLGDEPGAVVIRHGKGRVVLVADPSLLTWRGLRRSDNGMFLANVAALHARDGRVYFDEYHHGLRSGGGFWGYLHAHRVHGTILLILVVFAMAAWGLMVRLGRAVPVPPASHADAVDYASAVARIYQRAGARHLLARTLSRDFQNALTRHLHLRRAVVPAEILAAWRRQHTAADVNRLQTLLRGMVELRKGEVTERGLLAWAGVFDRFKAEVLRARGA
jgi:hypothetical protein